MEKMKLLLVATACSLGAHLDVQGQQGWEMKQAPLQTRWARIVDPQQVLPEYPRPQMVRQQWQNLNGLWEYAITPSDVVNPVGYQGQILVPFPLESALSGVKKALLPEQLLWYKRDFKKPTLKKNERILLNFGAVDWQATVFINGKEIGRHEGGYQNFSFDITDGLYAGDNQLVVKVYDPTDRGPNPHGKQVLQPQGIYYTASSGIWQTVWTEVVPVDHITSLRQTPDIDANVLHVNVKAPSTCELRLIASTGNKVVGTAKGRPNADIQLPVPGAEFWSPDHPVLYDLKVQLLKNGKLVDEVKSYFGMRKVEIRQDEHGKERIFLNNHYTFNLGVLDQGFWPDGLMTAPTDGALKFDIEAIKAMGFNTIRKHIKIEPARWYYYADKLGILVWQDMVQPAAASKEARETFEKESEEILYQLYNHPCITSWVLFNEGWGTFDQARLTKWLKEADPSRIINGHSGENYYRESPERIEEKWVNSNLTDIHAYPDPELTPALTGKAMVLGEFGGIGVSIEGHQWDDIAGWGYIDVTPDSLVSRYETMMKKVKQFEQEGLTASIYTEPFDVEGEQNGLITYDREIIKIPVEKLRQIHNEIIPITVNFETGSKKFTIKAVPTSNLEQEYKTRLREFERGRTDSVFLRRLALMALKLKDTTSATNLGNAYIGQLRNIYVRENILFIHHLTNSTKDRGFSIFQSNFPAADKFLGEGQARSRVMGVIFREELKPVLSVKSAAPDWNALESKLVGKFGSTGEEVLLFARYSYYRQMQDWNNFGKSLIPYMQKYGAGLDPMAINSFAWSLFEHSSDTNILLHATEWLRPIVDEPHSSNPFITEFMDTYANLLYKLGRKDAAIAWEGRALQIEPERDVYLETLNKMKKGEKTWK